jgi:hypothetical protein
VQLVQMQAKLSGFFFALRSRKCYQRFDVLHSIGEVVLSCAMFFSLRRMHGTRYGFMIGRR